MDILTTLFLFIVGFFMGLFNQNIPSAFPTAEEQQRQVETQQAWDNYYLIAGIQGGLRQYYFEENRYPETLQELNEKYMVFPDGFDFSQFSYVISTDSENYTMCLKREPKQNICVLKDSFLPALALTPDQYAIDKPLGDGLYMETWDLIKSSYGDQTKLDQALMNIAHQRYKAPDSIEFLTLYAWYLTETSHVYGSEYYQDTLEEAKANIERAASIDPNNMQVLLLEYNMAWIDNNQNVATAKAKQLLKQYPDNDIVKIETVYSHSPGTNIPYLEEFLSKEQSSVYLRKSAYYALITAYQALGNDDKVIDAYNRLTAEYKHPWDFQSLGFYWLREKDDCEAAITAFNEGLEYGEIGIMRHNNLPTAYAICAQEYAGAGEYDKAIEYMQIAVENNEDLPTCECEAEYLAGLGDFYYQRGTKTKTAADFQRAIRAYDMATEEDPTLSTAYAAKKRQATARLNIINKETNE